MRPQSPNADYWVIGLPVEFLFAQRFHLGSVLAEKMKLVFKKQGALEIGLQLHVLFERFATFSAPAVVCFPPVATLGP